MYLVDDNRELISDVIQADKKIGVIIEGDIERLHQALTIGYAIYASSGEMVFLEFTY